LEYRKKTPKSKSKKPTMKSRVQYYPLIIPKPQLAG